MDYVLPPDVASGALGRGNEYGRRVSSFAILRSTVLIPPCVLLCGGEGEEERAAVGQFAFGTDGAAVREHDVLGDGQAKACAS